MTTPKSTPVPQRKERNAFQAGCREFESRPPLPENRGITRNMGSSSLISTACHLKLVTVWSQSIQSAACRPVEGGWQMVSRESVSALSASARGRSPKITSSRADLFSGTQTR
jgi:hypothetical protein